VRMMFLLRSENLKNMYVKVSDESEEDI